MARATRVLNDDMLFSSFRDVPTYTSSHGDQNEQQHGFKLSRHSILGLWKAHGQGVHPKALIRRSSSHHLQQSTNDDNNNNNDNKLSEQQALTVTKAMTKTIATTCRDVTGYEGDEQPDCISFASDEEVRPLNDGSDGTDESWDDNEHWEHFDAWDVLKDEYAADFGFSFDPDRLATGTPDDDDQNVFLILGTSADDVSCQPHVLSPPLMDSLMTFLPGNLYNENYWLKFSLVRDGASLQTLKQYCRAAACTILAVETTQGQVFGSFTSSPWRNTGGGGFYGGSPAFVWKMRHGRRTKVASLFDQAQLESVIDVFEYNANDVGSRHGLESHVQVCRHDMLALGGDGGPDITHDVNCSRADGGILPEEVTLDRSGFALTLDADLSTGTTSPCKTFTSPALCGEGYEMKTFSVAGLEVWTFCPARDVSSAERLEMTKFFLEQSSRSIIDVGSPTSPRNSYISTTLSSSDMRQKEFYRRIGEDPTSEI